jgi:predicted glycoside hydrolase/deacetylase ChbG (UPF0249 family)
MSSFIIVTADDLGYSNHRDAAIFDLFKRGKVSGASLIVNGPSAEVAAKTALHIGLPLGLHINLTEGIPLTPCTHLKEEGIMPYKNKFRTLAKQNAKGFRQDVFAEVAAQLKKFERLTGYPATHVDGHQHAHVAPNVPSLLAPLFKSKGVRSVRIPEEWVEDYEWVSPELRLHYHMRYVDAVASRVVYGTAGLRMNDCTVAMAMSGTAMTLARLHKCLAGKKGVVEILTHPGAPALSPCNNKTFKDPFDTDAGRVHEWKILKDFNFGLSLKSWNDLNRI